jgi:hypothetical protein
MSDKRKQQGGKQIEQSVKTGPVVHRPEAESLPRVDQALLMSRQSQQLCRAYGALTLLTTVRELELESVQMDKFTSLFSCGGSWR